MNILFKGLKSFISSSSSTLGAQSATIAKSIRAQTAPLRADLVKLSKPPRQIRKSDFPTVPITNPLQDRLNALRLKEGRLAWNPHATLEQKMQRIAENKKLIQQHQAQENKALQARLSQLNPNAWNPNWSNTEKIQAIQARMLVSQMPAVPTHRVSQAAQTQALIQQMPSVPTHRVTRPASAPDNTVLPNRHRLPLASGKTGAFAGGLQITPNTPSQQSAVLAEPIRSQINARRGAIASRQQTVLDRLKNLEQQVLNNPSHSPQKRFELLNKIQQLRLQNARR